MTSSHFRFSVQRHAFVFLPEAKSISSLEQSGVDDPNFAYDLLTELTRTFLAYADDVRAQDSAAYAIQVDSRAVPTRLVLAVPAFWLVSSVHVCDDAPTGAAVHL